MYIYSNLGHLDIVILLVKYDAHQEARNDFGNTPLHRACGYGHIDVAMWLIENGT
jgi:ankyrin repeat protein